MTSTIYTHPLFFKHETPESHPECPKRYEILLNALQDYPTITPQALNNDDLILKAHTKNHLALLEESLIEDDITCVDGNDTYISNHSIETARQAVTNICQAITDIKSSVIERGFCLSRPPGHHAEPSKIMGFCLFNTIFLGALHARSIGYNRIAILDFDAHHGNGTEAMMRKHTPENMLFISSHESPFYPWTGLESNEYIHNHPLEAGSNGTDMRTLYIDKIFSALEEFNPDIVLVSAGFDAHKDDPYANLNWTTDDYAWLGRQLKPYKTVSTLEGGYNLPALKDSVRSYINSLDN